MKMNKYITTMIALGGLALSVQGQDAAENVEQYEADKKAVAEMVRAPVDGMINSNKLLSADVYNKAEEKVGNVDRLLLDPATGQVKYTIVSVGGFLGIGDRHVAVPWEQFEVKKVKENNQPDPVMETRTETDIDNEVTDAENENEDADLVAEESEAKAIVDDTDAELAEAGAEAEAATKSQVTEPKESDIDAEEADKTDAYARNEVDADDQFALRIYLDVNKERLEKAPAFDSGTTFLRNNDASLNETNSFWTGELSKTEAELNNATKTASTQ